MGHKCWIFSLVNVSSHGGLITFAKFIASNSFDIDQILDLADEEN